jgi:hypothetical protein
MTVSLYKRGITVLRSGLAWDEPCKRGATVLRVGLSWEVPYKRAITVHMSKPSLHSKFTPSPLFSSSYNLPFGSTDLLRIHSSSFSQTAVQMFTRDMFTWQCLLSDHALMTMIPTWFPTLAPPQACRWSLCDGLPPTRLVLFVGTERFRGTSLSGRLQW